MDPIEDGWHSLLESGSLDEYDVGHHPVLRWMFFAGASWMFAHIVEVSQPAQEELERFRKGISKLAEEAERELQ